MDILFRPLSIWPGKPTHPRKRSQFKAGYNDTLRLLDGELQKLRGRDVILQIALTSRDIRADGLPRVDARPSHPGIVLSFGSRYGPLSYPCDTFDRWEDNLRAIALGLEHLRAVDRYGVTRRGEQYQGWAAIAGPPPNRFANTDEAEAFIRAHGGDGDLLTAYRKAALKLHPDRGGKPEDFTHLQEAKKLLELGSPAGVSA